MSIYLIKKQWGYQTCCPDEDNVVGYFKPENPDTIQFYPKPNFDNNKLKKTKNINNEQWKYNNADSCNMTLKKCIKHSEIFMMLKVVIYLLVNLIQYGMGRS